MSELTEFRRAKDHFQSHDHHSPLTEEQKRTFHGLSYYDENPGFRFLLDLERYPAAEVVEMETSTGDLASFQRWDKVSFEVDGEVAQLTLYKDTDGDDFFLPFADATSGNETYGASRYLDVESLPDGRLRVDFNYSYNPSCAYNANWRCPLTPPENRIKVSIRAGELNFKE